MITATEKNILVTGGAGYIGSHICQALHKKGYQPVVYDNLSRGHKEAVQWGPLIQGELEDLTLLRRTLRDFQITAVIHCAGFAYVAESVEKPELYHRNNFVASLSLLEAMKQENCRHLIFSSSCAVYGASHGREPLVETTALHPINPYGESKMRVEQALKKESEQGWLSAISLRYFNAAGADPEGRLGNSHEPETRLIPLAILATQKKEALPLKIFGVDYATPDGTCLRDYVHVVDLAEAHVKALEFSKLQNGFDVFNLGAGRSVSVMEVIRAVEQVTQAKVRVMAAPRRAGDPEALIASIEKAEQRLHWRPERSALENLVKDAHNWLTHKKF